MRIVLALLIMTLPLIAQGDLRLYRINDDQEERRIPLMFGNKKPGCHNLMTTVPVHRAIVSRFKQCRVYSEADCEDGSVLKFHWSGRKLDHLDKHQITTDLMPGSKWIIVGTDNRDAKSWYCE